MTERPAPYTVLARRFRPQTFEEVVGQDRIGQALRNAILAERVAHAYLFTGARGVGKTSTARIFAKALNCPNVREAVPCNECEVCQSIAAGSDVDVLEIDGASNRGIDDIRTLRANVTVRSMRSPFKVYIIDEVHMLTKEAFNALLKTLEEPPPNVKFVFCTTEPNKVPDTILSRCQRFDFGTIASASIAVRLRQIAEAEGVSVDDAALELLARRAAGSMRDSQSLFDQLLAFGSDGITAADVHQLLGTAGDERLTGLMSAVIQRRRDEALASLDAALQEGVQVGALSDQILLYLRDLLIIAAGAASVPLESMSELLRSKLEQQASQWGLRTITAALEILSVTKSRMQRTSHERTLLELAVIRLSLLEELDLLAEQIEGREGRPGPGSQAVAKSPSPPRPQSSTAASPAASETSPPFDAPPSRAESSPALGDDDHSLMPKTGHLEPSPKSPGGSPTTTNLNKDNLPAIWSEILARLPDRLRGPLQKADVSATSGPNRLELSFPQSYVSGRQDCTGPESLARISECAAEVTGQPIEITVQASPESEQTATAARTMDINRPNHRREKPDLSNDPYVQQALELFSGSVVDVREIHDPVDEGQ